MGDPQPGCGGQIRPRGGHGGLEGCDVVFAGVLGSFLLWWPLPTVLLLWLAGGWAPGARSQGHGWGAPGSIVEGLRLEAGEGYGAIRSTPRRWQLMAIGNPEPPFREPPTVISMETKALSASPLIPLRCVGHQGRVCILGPTLRRGQRGRAPFPRGHTYSLPLWERTQGG